MRLEASRTKGEPGTTDVDDGVLLPEHSKKLSDAARYALLCPGHRTLSARRRRERLDDPLKVLADRLGVLSPDNFRDDGDTGE